MSGAVASGQERQGFTAARLARIAELERWHFWFAGRRALVDRLLDKHAGGGDLILDVGCGTGSALAGLVRRGRRVVGLDLRPEGLRALRQSIPAARLLQADAAALPLTPSAVGGVTLLDVVEHVDDHAVLDEVHRVLRPRGWVLVTAPALPWLWGYRDTAAGHRRRYTLTRMRHALERARFEVIETRWYQCLLLPLVLATRLIGRRRRELRDLEERPTPFLNTLLGQVSVLEVRLGQAIAWPIGSSLVAVGRKT